MPAPPALRRLKSDGRCMVTFVDNNISSQRPEVWVRLRDALVTPQHSTPDDNITISSQP